MMGVPYGLSSPGPYLPPSERQSGNAFEKFMLTLTGLSALGIFFLLALPLVLCVSLTFLCIVGNVLGSPATTPTQ